MTECRFGHGVCGDFQEAVELAIGEPRAVDTTSGADFGERPWLDMPEPTPQELRD